jgi:hypothetical protein
MGSSARSPLWHLALDSLRAGTRLRRLRWRHFSRYNVHRRLNRQRRNAAHHAASVLLLLLLLLLLDVLLLDTLVIKRLVVKQESRRGGTSP